MATLDSQSLQTRVDQSHAIHREQLQPAHEPSGIELTQLAGQDTSTLADQLQRQAFELGERLQAQQLELDRRQAEFNAQVACVENELRLARLMCAEREQELESRLSRKAAEAVAGSSLDPAAVAQVLRVESSSSAMIPESDRSPSASSDRWERRLADLESSERQLQAQIAQLDYDRKKFNEQRDVMLKVAAERNAKSQQTRQEARQQLQEGLQKLKNWSDDLDRRKAAVENLHQEALRMVRDALEHRICTEQLWAEIATCTSEAEMTRRIAALRCQLMDQFHLAGQRLEDQRQELGTLQQHLGKLEHELRAEREDLRNWLARRQEEIEAEAGKLRLREQQLELESSDMSRLQLEWRQQRHEYEQKIRRLSRLIQSPTSVL